MHTFRLILLLSCLLIGVSNYTAAAQRTMLIPYTKSGESRALILEDDDCVRRLQALVTEVFQQTVQDISITDYAAAVRKAKQDKAFIKGNEQDRLSILIRNADPEVYVLLDMEQKEADGLHWLSINLTAYLTSSSKVIKTATLDSGRFRYGDCVALLKKALPDAYAGPGTKKVKAIALDIDDAFGTHSGLDLNIDFSIAAGGALDYMSDVESGQLLFEAIEAYITETSLYGDTSPNVGSNVLKFSGIQVPSLNRETQKMSSASDYATALFKHLRTLRTPDGENLRFKFNVSGNNLYFTLQ